MPSFHEQKRYVMLQLLKNWWDGEYIPPDNDPASEVFLVLGHYRRHWTSRAAHVLVNFYLREWKWILGFLVALVSLYTAVSKFA